MVSPDWPEGVDGIRDYTTRLSEELAACGVDVVDLTSRRWGFRALATLRDRIACLRPCVVHVQHPSSYGLALAPQVLSLLHRGVVTFHEASGDHLAGSLARVFPFTLRAHHLIFTSPHEQDYVLRRAPWAKDKSSVIPIASNLPAGKTTKRRINEVVYFGNIRPRKGIEEVIGLARLIRQEQLSWQVRIVGTPSWWWRDYADGLRRQTEGLPVEWLSNLGHQATADALARAKVAYLPFPDGVSERRGSLLAVLASGAAVITTNGRQTPRTMRTAFAFASSPAEALPIVRRLLDHPHEWRSQAAAGQAFFAALPSWKEIAARHLTIYQTLAVGSRR